MTKTKANWQSVVAWYNAHGCNATGTARRFKLSRQTVHAYLNRVSVERTGAGKAAKKKTK